VFLLWKKKKKAYKKKFLGGALFDIVI